MLPVPDPRLAPRYSDYAHLERLAEAGEYGGDRDRRAVERERTVAAAQAAQRRALHPEESVWVAASAGTGKTKVLTDRLLALMLGGTDPAHILCLTFTRAAAAEMANRVNDRLAKWTTMPPGALLDVEPFVPARRDRQARPGLSRRPSSCAPGGPRPRADNRFQDHYLELDYDLSDVMFVTTANWLDIPQPLMDRMEIIRLEGYTEEEKVQIAKRHLIPKQMEAHGLKPEELVFADEALRKIIQHYTREAGVRTLERELAKVARSRCARSSRTRPRRSS